MSTCIKTGADVYLPEYNSVVHCDVHSFNDVVILNFYPEAMTYVADGTYDYRAIVGSGWVHDKKGVIVINASNFDEA